MPWGPGSSTFVNDIYTMTTFLKKVSKPVFQNLTVERHVSTPHIRLAKVTENPDTERTDERTNERTNGRTHGTSCFDYPTDVKSASRNNSQMNSQMNAGHGGAQNEFRDECQMNGRHFCSEMTSR